MIKGINAVKATQRSASRKRVFKYLQECRKNQRKRERESRP